MEKRLNQMDDAFSQITDNFNWKINVFFSLLIAVFILTVIFFFKLNDQYKNEITKLQNKLVLLEQTINPLDKRISNLTTKIYVQKVSLEQLEEKVDGFLTIEQSIIINNIKSNLQALKVLGYDKKKIKKVYDVIESLMPSDIQKFIDWQNSFLCKDCCHKKEKE